jgi:cytidine deaminase
MNKTSQKNIDIPELTEKIWGNLSHAAWAVRENAVILNKTKVGAALYSDDHKIFSGCNVEQVFRSHDIHAEVNSISNMVTAGYKKFYAILIVAERKRFTPCGSCMDWIMQFGGNDCKVGYQSEKSGKITIHAARELMPFYPE